MRMPISESKRIKIAKMFGEGKTLKEIAEALDISWSCAYNFRHYKHSKRRRHLDYPKYLKERLLKDGYLRRET